MALAGFIGVIASCGFVNTSQAQGFTVTLGVDENGHGTFMNSAGFNSSLPWAMVADPGPGGLASALTYDLLNPPGLTAGDVLILDPTPGLSDIVRFNSQQIGAGGGLGTIVFYSKAGEGDLADIGFPNALYANNVTVSEGPNDTTTYTPTAGQPGFVLGAGGPVTYIIKSSSVPDASASCSLLVIGLSGLFYFRRLTNA